MLIALTQVWLQIGKREATGYEGHGPAESFRQPKEQSFEQRIFELAERFRPFVPLHALQAVEHEQVRTRSAQSLAEQVQQAGTLGRCRGLGHEVAKRLL